MIDIPNKGEVLSFQVPEDILMSMYKVYHSVELPTELLYDNNSVIKCLSKEGGFTNDVDYKSISDWVGNPIHEFRLERISPSPQMKHSYLWNSRIPNLDFDKNNHLSKLDSQSKGWPSLFWHADTYQPESRCKAIIYLNDVDVDNGAVCMEESLTYINDDSYSEVQGLYDHVNDIPSKFYKGKAGTCVLFRARQLHRINFPNHHHRDAVHIGFDCE